MLAPFVPESFRRALQRDFQDKLRVRWSPVRNRWQIERRGRETARPTDPNDRFDTWARVASGYYRVLETSPGSLICCSFCKKDYSHPMFTLQAAKCPHCEKEELVMNWPLGDRLLEHLRFTDPDRDGLDRLWKDLERQEREKSEGDEREKKNVGEAIWKEEFNSIFEIQSRGYEGPAKAWMDAPKSKMFGGNE